MAKTILEISNKVLSRLGRLPDGQVAPQSQVQVVEDAYDGLYEELLNDSLVNWASTDDIPDFASNSIQTLLLGMVADEFGVPNQWIQLTDIARSKLSQQLALPYVSQPTTFENI